VFLALDEALFITGQVYGEAAARRLARGPSTHARPHLQADDLIAFFGSQGFVKHAEKC
jgi:hypothetical protein